MSNYRDDTHEIAVARSSTWAGLASITEEVARARDEVTYGLRMLVDESAAASDETTGRVRYLVVDSVQATDQAIGKLTSRSLVVDTLSVRDRVTSRLFVMHDESATASDLPIDSLKSFITERAELAERYEGLRKVATLIVDSARARDQVLRATTELVEDSIQVGDWSGGRLSGRSIVLESAALSDEAISQQNAVAPILMESAHFAAEVVGHLLARQLVIDSLQAEDDAQAADKAHGQAWTSNSESWAMSRYAPFTFLSLAVIDGIVYGVADDGIYALDSEDEQMLGVIKTAPVDIGKGALVHPLSAYLEYELDGAAEMDVVTTQSGAPERYTYLLPAEQAAALTNGRFEFGRGLRGRHFSFELRLDARRGYINDLSVLSAPTKRRV